MSNKKKYFNNSGQVMVEFAIILPLLLVLVFGITEFGRYLYLKNSVTNAAREAARAAVVSPAANYTTNINAAVYNYFPSSLAGLSITPVPSTAPTTGSAVNVTVRISFKSAVPNLIPLFKNLTSIRASATMRYE